jgi:hypothetical protein
MTVSPILTAENSAGFCDGIFVANPFPTVFSPTIIIIKTKIITIGFLRILARKIPPKTYH